MTMPSTPVPMEAPSSAMTRPAPRDVKSVYASSAPTARIAACARLMISSTPKISVKPSAKSA